MFFLEEIKNRNGGKVTEALPQGQISFLFSQAIKQQKTKCRFCTKHTGHSLSNGSVCDHTRDKK